MSGLNTNESHADEERLDSSAAKTPANNWKSLSAEQRLSYLSTLPCLTSSGSIVDDALNAARSSIPFLGRTVTPRTPGLTVTKIYHPVSKVAIITESPNPETALAYAVLPLLAGCHVALCTTKQKLDKLDPALQEVISFVEDDLEVVHGADVVIHVGSRSGIWKRGMGGKGSLNMYEYIFRNVALVIGNTANVSQVVEAIFSLREWGEVNISVYVCHEACNAFNVELRRSETGSRGKGGGLNFGMTGAISVSVVESLGEAIVKVNGGDYDIVSLFGEARTISTASKVMKARLIAMNTSPITIPLLAQGPETIRQFLSPRSVLVRTGGQLSLMKQYLIGRFDNSAQVAAEKAAGGQCTGLSILVNGLVDDKIEGGTAEGMFHILSETYKFAPGDRNARIILLLLRFEDVDGGVALTYLRIPEGIDGGSLRNDNPMLFFKKRELAPAADFPERQMYVYDEERMEFHRDVETVVDDKLFLTQETIRRDGLTVLELVLVGDELNEGCYKEPYRYDRIYTT